MLFVQENAQTCVFYQGSAPAPTVVASSALADPPSILRGPVTKGVVGKYRQDGNIVPVVKFHRNPSKHCEMGRIVQIF